MWKKILDIGMVFLIFAWIYILGLGYIAYSTQDPELLPMVVFKVILGIIATLILFILKSEYFNRKEISW